MSRPFNACPGGAARSGVVLHRRELGRTARRLPAPHRPGRSREPARTVPTSRAPGIGVVGGSNTARPWRPLPFRQNGPLESGVPTPSPSSATRPGWAEAYPSMTEHRAHWLASKSWCEACRLEPGRVRGKKPPKLADDLRHGERLSLRPLRGKSGSVARWRHPVSACRKPPSRPRGTRYQSTRDTSAQPNASPLTESRGRTLSPSVPRRPR